MDDLVIVRPVGLDQDVSVNIGALIPRIGTQALAVLRIDEIKLAVASLNPIVANYRPRRSVL